MKFLLPCALLLFASVKLTAASVEEKAVNPSALRIVAVKPTPEPDEVDVRIAYPEPGQLKSSMPLDIQIRAEGFTVGTDSDFPRADEIAVDSQGQSICVMIDDDPSCYPIYEALIDALDTHENYYDSNLELQLNIKLSPGYHVIRAFPVRSYGESFKGDKCFAATGFYYKSKTGGITYDLTLPYLTYNRPFGTYKYIPGGPILLDFYVSNCRLSRDGYKVRVTIDDDVQRTLTEWAPYYIYGLTKGSHKVRLELLDSRNKRVVGPFSMVQRTINLK